MLLSEALGLFLRARAAALSDSTKRYYRTAINRLIVVVGDIPIADIHPPHLWDFLADLTEQKTRWRNCRTRPAADGGLSPYTIDRMAQAVRSFFKWLVKYQYLDRSPAANLEYKKPPELPPKMIQQKHIDALLVAATHPRDRAFVRVALSTGARRGGLQGMKQSDIDLSDCSVMVTEKGDKTRKVYYDVETAAVLERWLKMIPDSIYVWVKDDGEPLGLAGIRQIMVRLCRKAKIPSVSLHQLRHTFAYMAIKSGVNIGHIQTQMGHAEITTTERYMKQLDIDRQNALQQPLFTEPERKPTRELFKRVK